MEKIQAVLSEHIDSLKKELTEKGLDKVILRLDLTPITFKINQVDPKNNGFMEKAGIVRTSEGDYLLYVGKMTSNLK